MEMEKLRQEIGFCDVQIERLKDELKDFLTNVETRWQFGLIGL